jgi:hypothetical protein
MTAVYRIHGDDEHGTSEHAGSTAVSRPPLLSLLVEAGVADEEQLRIALAEGMGRGERLGEVVLRRGWLDEEGLAQLLARQWELPFLGQDVLESVVVVPLPEARQLEACLVSREDGTRMVVVAEPTSDRLNAARELLGGQPAFAVVTPATLELLLERLAQAPEPHPAAAEPQGNAHPEDDVDPDLLISELETATDALAALRERVEQLTARRHAVERELPALRSEVDRLSRRYADAQELVREREQELERERERHTTLRERLGELLRESGG